MPDKELAIKLGAAIEQFCNDWIPVNGPGGQMSRTDVLCALITMAADLIAAHPSDEARLTLCNSAIMTLVGHSNADLCVAVHRSPKDAFDQMLAYSPVAGRA